MMRELQKRFFIPDLLIVIILLAACTSPDPIEGNGEELDTITVLLTEAASIPTEAAPTITLASTTNNYAPIAGKMLLIVENTKTWSNELFLFDSATKQLDKIELGIFSPFNLDVSPDGEYIVFSGHDGTHSGLYLLETQCLADLKCGNSIQGISEHFASNEFPTGNFGRPAWSSQGDQIAYDFYPEIDDVVAHSTVEVIDLTDFQKTSVGEDFSIAPEWLGNKLLYNHTGTADRLTDFWVYDLETGQSQELFADNTTYPEVGPYVVSPDQEWIYFTGTVGWDQAIYRISIDGNNVEKLIPDGNILKISPGGQFLALTIFRGNGLFLSALDGTNIQKVLDGVKPSSLVWLP